MRSFHQVASFFSSFGRRGRYATPPAQGTCSPEIRLVGIQGFRSKKFHLRVSATPLSSFVSHMLPISRHPEPTWPSDSNAHRAAGFSLAHVPAKRHGECRRAHSPESLSVSIAAMSHRLMTRPARADDPICSHCSFIHEHQPAELASSVGDAPGAVYTERAGEGVSPEARPLSR